MVTERYFARQRGWLTKPFSFTLSWQRTVTAAAVASYSLFLLATGRLIATGSTRLISVAILLVVALMAAQARPMTLLMLLIAVCPLPLYVQGIGASITPVVVLGVWLSLALSSNDRASSFASARAARLYGPWLALIGSTILISLWRGTSDRTAADLGALGRVAIGMAIFLACLVSIRSAADLSRAYAALAAAGAVVFMIAIAQLVFPSITIPGLLGKVGTIQANESGLSSNLRVGGPVGDYELLGEILALSAVVAAFFALRADGARKLRWAVLVSLLFVGIATTSTRSSFAILLVGIFLTLLVLPRIDGGRPVKPWITVALGIILAIPVITVLQRAVGTGYLFERLEATRLSGGLPRILNRSGVWSYFLEQLPHGQSLLLGSGPAFDYSRYQTYPHSLPLTLVFTVGILGAMVFYGFLVTILVRCIRCWRKRNDAYAFIGGLLVLLFVVNEVSIEYVRAYNYEWFVWAMLGVSAASSMGLYRQAAP